LAHDIAVVPETLAHCIAVAECMRAADRAEVWALGRHSPVQAVVRSIAVSAEAWVFTADGVPLAVFGVAPVTGHPGVGSPWLLGADGVQRHVRPFLALGREYVGRWLGEYPRLYNVVDARNRSSIRWLSALGFAFHPAVPVGPEQRPFLPFDMRA
jgi:hypothetical protein